MISRSKERYIKTYTQQILY